MDQTWVKHTLLNKLDESNHLPFICLMSHFIQSSTVSNSMSPPPPCPEQTQRARKQGGGEGALPEQSLTDTDQQKATEKPNQDGRQEIKKGKQKQERE